MTTPLEAMKAALEALDDATYLCQMYGSIGRREQAERWQLDYPAHYDKAMKAKLNLRTAIAQLERTDHIKVTRAAWTGNTTYSCKYCGDDFRSQHQAAAHQCGKMPAKIAQLESAEKIANGLRPLAESCKQTKFRRDIKIAVDRFLGWKLPEEFGPDCYVSFDRDKAKANNGWPIGTNLLTADQAKAMFEHCLEGTGYVACMAQLESAEPVAEVTQEDINQIAWLAPSLGIGRGSKLYAAPQPAIPEWQPIETAPKDGTYILVGNATGVWVALYRPFYQSGYKAFNPWMSLFLNHDHIQDSNTSSFPTHWMPLPAAPKPENSHE